MLLIFISRWRYKALPQMAITHVYIQINYYMLPNLVCMRSADNGMRNTRIAFREYRFPAHKVSRAYFPEEFAEKMFPRSDIMDGYSGIKT